ncbi:ribosome biogenesis factor YjgA [Rivibacter subsaxonicus]|uniref:Dual-action ribosomal maturation protein DarP n=1 Tax=Rivibacter subsaxonicus TaxID=457575 RepID=A0A4Q7VNF7_9BURK|nr:ribosome biogenesis factor YjgA [Rivibacter subsaxonicus]RZT97717.1 ribosome-associated protein [Rivibacter subsaxonicus]
MSPRRPSVPLEQEPDAEVDDGVDENGYSRPSKSQLKRESHELQELGEALLELPANRVDDLDLSDRLREVIADAHRVKTHEGRRRQLQLLGKLMRGIDPQPIREAVASFRLGHARNALALHQVEVWRSDLIANDSAITRWIGQYPQSDVQQLRQLLRAARRDVQPDAAPGLAQRQQRAYRELFQWLRAVLEAESNDEEEQSHERDNRDDEIND